MSSSRITGAHSWDSAGRTLRNQPTAPASAKTTPRKLTEAAVTNPADTKVKPKAITIGHAVGAGTSIFSGIFITPPLNSDHVNDCEDNYPHEIHEVPIHGWDFEALGMLAPESRGEIEERDCYEGKQT